MMKFSVRAAFYRGRIKRHSLSLYSLKKNIFIDDSKLLSLHSQKLKRLKKKFFFDNVLTLLVRITHYEVWHGGWPKNKIKKKKREKNRGERETVL